MEDDVMYEPRELTSSTLGKTFFWLFMGLLATGFIAWYSYASGWALQIDFTLVAVLELVVVFVFSLFFRKLSATMVTFLYFVYAIINGFTFSVLFYLYDLSSIMYLFFITAGMFGALAYIGTQTRKRYNWMGKYVYGCIVCWNNNFNIKYAFSKFNA